MIGRMGQVAAVVVVLVSSCVLLAAAHTSVGITSSLVAPGEAAGWRSSYAATVCLRREFRLAVPKGGDVYLGNGGTSASQSLLEAAALWAQPVVSPRTAKWEVSLQQGPACGGFQLKVHRLR